MIMAIDFILLLNMKITFILCKITKLDFASSYIIILKYIHFNFEKIINSIKSEFDKIQTNKN